MTSASRRIDSGFSFVELLAYMAIAALLILAAVPQFDSYRARAADTNVQADLRNVAAFAEGLEATGPVERTNTLLSNLGPGQITLTKSAYSTTANVGMALCMNSTDVAVIAESKSGRIFEYSSKGGGVRLSAASAIPENDSCASAGVSGATSTGYTGAYVLRGAEWWSVVR